MRSALQTAAALAVRPQDWFSSARVFADQMATRSNAPHFVRDYRKMVVDLVLANGAAAAMQQGVGGQFQAIGRVQADLLLANGLQASDRIIDVGCGSGRLASVLSSVDGLRYLGTDVVPEFIRHARKVARADFEFELVSGLAIPAQDESADFVVLFSVLTHLHTPEAFIYLGEAARVLRPGGKVIATFLDPTDAFHWDAFASTVENIRLRLAWPVNAFLTVDTMELFARKLGYTIIRIHIGAEMPLLGQSVAVMQKPAAG